MWKSVANGNVQKIQPPVQISIDLRELDATIGFNLQIDKAQSVLGMIIAGIGIFSMLWMNRLLFTDSPGLISGMLIARSCYVLITALFIYAVGKTNRVRIFIGSFWAGYSSLCCSC